MEYLTKLVEKLLSSKSQNYPSKGTYNFKKKKLFTLICVIFISLEILSDFLVGFNDVCLEGFNLCCAVECSALQCSRVVECSCTS